VTPYQVTFDDVVLGSARGGTVEVYLITTDTNPPDLARNGLIGTAPWTASQLPIFTSVDMNLTKTLLTFTVTSQTQLSLIAGALTLDVANNEIIQTNWSTTGGTSGAQVTYPVTNPTDGTWIYYVTMRPVLIGQPSFPPVFAVSVANDVGTTIHSSHTPPTAP
jgi:hypothetical protein